MVKVSASPRVQVNRIDQHDSEPELGDLRFRSLLSAEDWAMLPAAVRRRFSKRLIGGATAIYSGKVTAFRASLAGRILAQCLRFAGAPLPIFDHVDVPSVVSVTEDVKTGGQIWTRMYANRTSFPQVIHSAKRFSGPTGLEEFVGCGIVMLLKVKANEQGLTFSSAGYQIKIGAVRLTLPRWMSPGHLTVTHTAHDDERFTFGMTLTHPLLGELIHQSAVYRDGIA